MAGAIGRGARPIGHVPLGIFRRVPAEAPLVDFTGIGSAERHAQMLKLDDRIHRLATHVCDRVLVAEPVGTSHRIEHVPAPFVVFDISQGGADATLRRDGVASRGKDLGDAGRV